MTVAEGLTGRRWPGHPHRQDDELLSCWFVRTANANCLSPQSFGSQTFGKRAFVMTRDLDRWTTDEHIEVLSTQTGASFEELRGGLLTSYEGIVYDQHAIYGNTKWILPSVSYIHQRRRYGMQFCPLCLFFDKEPYFRRRWRMAFSTICDVHGSMLHDRCPECGAPVAFFRNNMGDVGYRSTGDLAFCWECGNDLRRAPVYSPSGPDGKTIMALRSLITFHEIGWWFQGNNPIQYGTLYFEVLHRLTHYLATSYGKRFLEAVESETGWRVDIARERPRSEFESKPIAYRHQMMMAILWLLDDWPKRFIKVAQSVGATQSQINDGRPFPFWFESELRLHLGGGHYNLTTEEVQAAVVYLEKGGQEISASAIGRLLGRKDSRFVRPYVKPLSQSFDTLRLARIVEKYDALHADLPITSRPRLVWQRDKTILLLIHLTGWTYRKVRKLNMDDFPLQAKFHRGLDSSVLSEINALLDAYLAETRCHLADATSGNAMLIKWKGGVLTGESWRTRRMKYEKACSDPS